MLFRSSLSAVHGGPGIGSDLHAGDALLFVVVGDEVGSGVDQIGPGGGVGGLPVGEHQAGLTIQVSSLAGPAQPPLQQPHPRPRRPMTEPAKFTRRRRSAECGPGSCREQPARRR